MIVLAHLSDTHLDGSEHRAARAKRVLDYLTDLPGPVAAVLVTGDLADHGTPAEYEEVRKTLASANPVFTCPGNHDVRESYRSVLLGERAGGGPVNRLHHAGGAVFAMCDSSIPGRDEGYLDDETLAWLGDALAATDADTPVFVCFHHPPVRLHSPFIDGTRQRGEERLAALLARYPQVVAVLCGHAHTGAASSFAGKPLRVAPGVVSTLKLPWEHRDDLDYDLPPAIAFHVLDDDRRLTTHYRVVP
ncbi:metallophosphoesterase [Amycolatopsis acidiphila]|uniref:Phosphodiesterase n=1 Tax=Amycolatopsis acidiphila TaxID=715473 RepID=A0A558AAN6_9PSEU|nr:metallophosphoesterase [Amycolatopsis acidiphila]TVT21312.1 phosphodiesterase [Amycolatopsis acidiphila]UIJ63525.1 metallophosphoesterase [Amycolatopsis acidiphila]GHG68456.1 3',5'-cyclic adenosine monophosphate phosphodiesterase CpdA [Amycolatopsis acidiphila]